MFFPKGGRGGRGWERETGEQGGSLAPHPAPWLTWDSGSWV